MTEDQRYYLDERSEATQTPSDEVAPAPFAAQPASDEHYDFEEFDPVATTVAPLSPNGSEPHTDAKAEEDYDYEDFDDPEPASSWKGIDLVPVTEAVWSGTVTRPTPTVGRMSDGHCLFYPGKINGVHGEPASAKTWICLLTAAQEINAGHHVFWIDFEDDEYATVTRLAELGAERSKIEQCFHYIHPHEPYSPDAQTWLEGEIKLAQPTLVVIDSVGEAMAMDGIEPNSDAQVALWFQRLPRAIANLGPAVVSPDHVTKSKDGRGQWAIGSQRKGAVISGATYSVEVAVEFAKGRKGIARIVCAKDRHGNHKRGQKVTEFVLDATDVSADQDKCVPGCLKAELVAMATGEPDSRNEFQPTYLMEQVSHFIEDNPGAGSNEIAKAVRGDRTFILRAVTILVDEGYIKREEGPRRSHLHFTIQPYRQPVAEPDLSPRLAGLVAGSGSDGTEPEPASGGGVVSSSSDDSPSRPGS